MSEENTQKLAEQIAKLLQVDKNPTLDKINQRLDAIETRLASQNPKSKIQNPKSPHPSQQKFDVIEAIADEIIENYENEKACTFEPNGKPCDHCSMCSSMGF